MKSNVEKLKVQFKGRPSEEEAKEAVKVILRYIGEDPTRDGLLETPKRVVKSFAEFYAGYSEDPQTVLSKTFAEVGGYEEMILLKDIEFQSTCEHHMQPIIGRAHIAYIPNKRIVGISKLARVVEIFAKRLQVQEKMTAQVAKAIDDVLQPLGVAVFITAKHHCMSARGVKKENSLMDTSFLTGMFKLQPELKKEFLAKVGKF